MKIFLKALKKSLAKPRTFVLCYFATVQYYMERNGTVMLKIIDDFVWGVPLIVLILAVGIFLTIRLRGLQITKLPLAVRHIIANEKDGKDGEVSSFGALCTALSATIGTGNIVGVATAVVAGGPGALFWMWIAALFGTATKYAECLLAIKYRVVEADGHVVGGPFYYIENGMGRKFRWLGQIFAFFGVGVGLLGIGTFTQINGITGAVKGFFDPETACSVHLFSNTYSWSVVISGLILTVCVALVIIGGIKRISSVAQVVVPFMALVYVGDCADHSADAFGRDSGSTCHHRTKRVWTPCSGRRNTWRNPCCDAEGNRERYFLQRSGAWKCVDRCSYREDR